MKKVDEVRFWLNQDLPPKEVAQRTRCSLSWVYQVRGRRAIAAVKHQLGVLTQMVHELQSRVDRLERVPPDVVQRMLSRNSDR
jgi:hypothetical protein